MGHVRRGKAGKERRRKQAQINDVTRAQFFAHLETLPREDQLLYRIFGKWEECDECRNQKLVGTDCQTSHCKTLRDEESKFYDEITDAHITINGSTLLAGFDY